ncbi:C-type lectin domain family 1 member B-like [Hemibagrus wyckioides]|uniref:C-type lectin domain family 1 member B-like n=1 Tax=Hemibagrus wyckioides TaxID=337641 RepID=UPI00266CB18D|nr:C-type lectin domain family 1 member B-like [Hemibagrus wyckioides]
MSEHKPSREVQGIVCRPQRQDCIEAQIWERDNDPKHSAKEQGAKSKEPKEWLQELEMSCKVEWEKMPKNKCVKLVASYSKRFEAVIDHSKVVSTERHLLKEKHDNAPAKQMVLKYNATETEQLNKIREKKYQQVHEHLSACNGWKSLGLKGYYFSTDKLNWTQSRDYCVEKGDHLVIITSQPEQGFLFSQIGETEGQWMWVNNQPLKETGVTFWYSAPEGPNEPDNWKMQENCAALGDSKGNINKWFDASCHTITKCICEK